MYYTLRRIGRVRGAVAVTVAGLMALAGAVSTPTACAASGPLGIDHPVAYDNAGIWKRSYQLWLIDAMVVGEGGIGLWEGGQSRFGHTIWQSIDATVVGGVASEVLKYSFSRERPSQTSDPNHWFTGHGQSFPSGEVTVTSAIVTPLVLEYAHEYPAIYALEAIPLYDAIARVKVHGHWQSDVIAGYALGTTVGYFMHRRSDTPWVLSVMPDSIYVGLKKSL